MSLKVKEMDWMANMTELNHLGKALLLQPQKMMGVLDTLFSAQNYYSDNPMLSLLMGSKNEQIVDGLEWEWDMKGADTRPLVIVENIIPTNTTPGKFKSTFQIKLDENWFIPGDVITPGAADKRYQVRIVDDPQRQGDGWVYTVRLMSDDDNFFLAPTYLTPGTQWSKLFSNYEEGAEQSGSTTFSTTISFRNRLTKYRKQYKITDYASTAVLAVKIPDKTGKLHDSWIRYAEVEFLRQWYRELERAIWYSRSSNTVIGSTGRPVRSSAGIEEQLVDSHREPYSVLTAKFIEEYLMDIFYSRKKPGEGRNIKAFTGEYGMLQFHRAVTDELSKKGFLTEVSNNFVEKSSSSYHTNAMSYGYQFTKYKMANGATLELIHNPLYDDREINSEIDPITGFPIESQKFTFLDFGGDMNSSNIKLKKKKDGDAFGYVCGMYGPYGPSSKASTPVHAGDYYEMHIEAHKGVEITDPTRCGQLYLARN